jgi:hypothetical protein
MTDIEIVCNRSSIRTAILLVRTREAFIRKLLAADVRLSGCQRLTVWMRLSNRKDLQQIFGISVAQLSVWTAYDHRLDGTRLYQARRSFEPSAYK